MEIAGFLASILIGISLGLIGGGGSILTVPVLVYLFHVDAVLATTYSLFVVGATSFVGSTTYFKNKLIDFKTVFAFGIPSIIGVYISRQQILPHIPDVLFNIGGFEVTKSNFLMLVFAVLMLMAAFKMIKKDTKPNNTSHQNYNYPLVVFQGFLVGIITGFVGAGGGFLIIPALVSLLKTPMKKAIGTSLLIIAINSAFGFVTSYAHFGEVNWKFLLSITTMAIIGILIGSRLSRNIDGKKLKPAFGWFVLVMGIFVIVKEMFF
ncbi:sulfite exporter TauE/SafE family protein [Chryseobacterium sp. POL2]|uniref:sulfite exporter TauE/SafE family protein n=1 Tax=Chryseobacterium sp. POL2 TaxID=2713414 RepID=UPI0013E17E8E|nr:sulfite exporter TauE/SafE family protein [Chryseobacterium sp. POL2]QIG89527.1 sulfite exporter TauE/SafE family protein [Chryseobacterium sp. POL2]